MNKLPGHLPGRYKNNPLPSAKQRGLSLIEVLIASVIAGLLIKALSDVVNTAVDSGQTVHIQNDALQQARFALERITRAVSKSRQLRLPLAENRTTAWSESVRNVLAVTLDPTLDRNKDGWADANNDKDFLDVNKNGSRDAGEPERIDEDTNFDNNNDGAPGIKGIDDNNDGIAESLLSLNDNDEDGTSIEDSINGMDDDTVADGSIDEDLNRDMNNDTAPGISGVDDDYDGTTDEGKIDDDDEDGLTNEDWIDEQVFYLSGTTLLERLPNFGAIDGTAYTEFPLVENVSQFRVERILGANGRTVLVDVTLTLSPPGGAAVSLNTRMALASGL